MIIPLNKLSEIKIKLIKDKKFWVTTSIIALFYAIWTLRGWYSYAVLETGSFRDWFLFLSKYPSWIVLAIGLLWYNFGKGWLQKSGLRKFNFQVLGWASVAILAHLIYLFFPSSSGFGVYNFKFDFSINLLAREIINGFTEELLFRATFQPFLEKYFGKLKSNILQAILFSAIHWCWWLFAGEFTISGAIYIAILGFFWGWIRQKSDSIYGTTIAHTVHNLILGWLG
jgi:membrane protease YdiL (CAAX protease family)